MNNIEIYRHSGPGYEPVLIKQDWQAAYLSEVPGHRLDDLTNMERHNETDEAFIALGGKCILITAEYSDRPVFSARKLEKGIIYNIPAGVWHNIAMDNEARMLIVEKAWTHMHDVEYRNLTEDERRTVTFTVTSACE